MGVIVVKELSHYQTIRKNMAENASPSFNDYLKRAQERLLILPGAMTVYARGDGAYVYDRDGRRFLDGNARAGQVSFGHNNPLIYETDQKMREAGAQCFETIGDFWQSTDTSRRRHCNQPRSLAERNKKYPPCYREAI